MSQSGEAGFDHKATKVTSHPNILPSQHPPSNHTQTPRCLGADDLEFTVSPNESQSNSRDLNQASEADTNFFYLSSCHFSYFLLLLLLSSRSWISCKNLSRALNHATRPEGLNGMCAIYRLLSHPSQMKGLLPIIFLAVVSSLLNDLHMTHQSDAGEVGKEQDANIHLFKLVPTPYHMSRNT